MSINKPIIAVLGAAALWTSVLLPQQAKAQTSDAETNRAVMQLSVLFLQQVVGAWSVVLPKWDRDPTEKDWQTALERCSTTMPIESPKIIGDADPQMPPSELLVGSLVYYRGPSGLQQLSAIEGDLRKFPKLQIGRSNNDTPVYQIAGSGGAATMSLGKIPSDKGEFIVMIRDSTLLLRCQPNATE